MSEVPARPSRPDPAQMSAVGRGAMISTSHPAASAAGVAALRAGGSAVDAYLAAAAVQTVVEPTMTTLGGGLMVAVYDPATGAGRMVAAAGGLPAAEDGDLDEAGRWSGRTVVTPGWVLGAHAAWSKWGRLGWAELFSGALTAAREGFTVDQLLWGWAFECRTVAGRYAAGRRVWFPDGHMFGVGEVLRQPELAETIGKLAEQGPSYFYEGEFARRYVETARAAGGRITLDDMAAGAAADVALPVLPVAGGYELHTTGSLYALMLSMAGIGGLGRRGRPDEDPESLYLLMRIVEEAWHYGLSISGDPFSGKSPLDAMADAVSPEVAERLWRQVESGPPRPFDAMNMGTNAIVVVDGSGMIAYGTHSATSTPFGVGLMVDGVVVTRPITLFTERWAPIPMGWGTSLLAVRDGRPVLAAGSPSVSALQNVLQNSVNILERGMDPAESVRQPMFGAARYPSRRPMVESTMGEQAITEVERRGLGITRVSPWEPEMGSFQAVHIRPDGTLHGVADPRRLGRAAGY
ncbi:gamma-glutamyltransferase [Rhizohabitans arisaemae]|uniref:gamma-glutamyltransferase n=1 Tax=Rhizohabitans arisaemae TaxID=2720610 RepID=UPI0024B242C7|nr:gamma-glutamyltransferase [Rhizohabitans arisaemae]